MKTKFIISGFIAFVLLSSFGSIPDKIFSETVVSEKAATGFSFFRTHRQGKDGITATWGVTTASGVSSFYVQRTYEDPADPYAFWETWASLPFTGNRSYKVTDRGVFPGFISYRVIAVLSDGTEVTSDVSTVHIVSH